MKANDLLKLEGKNALVTVGGKGIGLSIAESFAKFGANVVIIVRNLETLNKSINNLKLYNNKCFFIQADINNLHNNENILKEILNNFGCIDILVNNAGVNIPKPALEVTPEDWDNIINTNLKSCYFLTQHVAKQFIKQNVGGRVISIASQLSFVVYENRAPYCISKGGLKMMIQSLAAEWAKHNILVTEIAPTYIKTDLTSATVSDSKTFKEIHEKILLGRLGEMDDIANAALYLGSDMGKFITGEIIKVDGQLFR